MDEKLSRQVLHMQEDNILEVELSKEERRGDALSLAFDSFLVSVGIIDDLFLLYRGDAELSGTGIQKPLNYFEIDLNIWNF